MFDDVFSGQDSGTQEFLFNRLFRPGGILRDSETTVIMSTHSGKPNSSSHNVNTNYTHLVELLPSADLIIALDKTGNVVERGTFEKLNANQGYVHSLSIDNTSTTNDNGNNSESESIKAPVLEIFKVEPAAAIDLMSDSSRQSGEFSVYKYYFDTVGMWWCALFLATLVGFAFFYAFSSKSQQSHLVI